MPRHKLWPIRLILLAMAAFSTPLQAQNDEYVTPQLRNYDYVYRDHIKSVRFYLGDSEIAQPIIELGSTGPLILEFDDMDGAPIDYYYKVIHCNANWTPSEDIDAIDYINGYQENRFFDYETSFNTRTSYVHYELKIPNDDIKWTISGNYLLKIYLNENEEDLVITRRFMVVDTKMKVVPKMRNSARPPYSTTHQEFYFRIEHAGIQVGNATAELKLAILQNGRWDNALTDLKPTFIENKAVIYNNQGKLLFAGNREFRPLDIRSFRHRSPQVKYLTQDSNSFYLELFPNTCRKGQAYLFTHDVNGKYILETFDEPDVRTRGEYGKIKFSLKSTELTDGEVYILGSFTDFQAYDEFKMSYNVEAEAYEATVLLKNGFYDYVYAFLPNDSDHGALDWDTIEGSTYEAENDYYFLVYFREFGGRYDQLVAVQKMNSNPNR